jgi:hypothetical protein
MRRRTHFVIFKDNSRYSIREYGNSDMKQAFFDEGVVGGDGSVLIRFSRVIPDNVTFKSFLERNANHVIFCE